MREKAFIFCQFMAPYPSAAALRGEALVAGLVKILARSRAITVFTSSGGRSRSDGVTIVPMSGAELDNTNGLLARFVGELRLGFEVGLAMVSKHRAPVLISSPAYLSSLVIAGICRLFRTPYVLDVRDIYPQVYDQAGVLKRSSPIYAILLRLSRRMYRGARCCMTATEGLKHEVARDDDRRQVFCVYNGYPAALSAIRPAKHRRFTLCFHGVLGFFQDVETLVRLAEALQGDDIDLVVIGYGRKADLLSACRLPNLRFLGKLPFDETMAEVSRCQVGLCLRRGDEISRDAFPVKVWEYLGLEIPSVITPICEAGDFVERHGCGIQLPAGDHEAVRRTILGLRDDEVRLAAMRSRCATAAARFSREQTGVRAARIFATAFRMA